MEAVGRVESWQSESGHYLEGTPFVSKFVESVPWGPKSGSVGWLRDTPTPESTPVLGTTPRVSTVSGNWLAERVWMPWTFEPVVGYGVAVSSVGLGAIASGINLIAAGSLAIGSTEVLPAVGVFPLINPSQITMNTTSLWDEAGAIRLLTPGLRPRTLRIRESIADLLTLRNIDPRASDAISAVSDLMRWLNRGRDEVADICRFSLRSSHYWATGKTPRPTTVRRLYEVHGFVASLVHALGRLRAREWLEESSGGFASRLQLLATEEGIATILREASPILFAEQRPLERPRPEPVEAAEAAAAAGEYDPGRFRGEPRRPRRTPADGG